jgi:prepilin-type N-terminal cleavage/methylation domain-containing protein
MKKISLSRNGYTLLETMIALMISGLIFLCIYQVIQMMSYIDFYDQRLQDINGLLQLKQALNLGSNIEVSSNEIEYDFKENHFTIGLINNRLIIQPGTNILILDIDNIEFIEDDQGLIIIYQRNDRIYHRRIYG